MLQAGSKGGGEVSALWGQRLGMEWLWFIFHRAKSKPGKCGLGGRQENPPSLIEGCFSIVPGEARVNVGGVGGEGREEDPEDEKEEAAREVMWEPISIPAQFIEVCSNSLPHPQLEGKHGSLPTNCQVLEGRQLILPSFLPLHCLHCYMGSKQVLSECLLNGINSAPRSLDCIHPCHSQNTSFQQQLHWLTNEKRPWPRNSSSLCSRGCRRLLNIYWPAGKQKFL